MSSASCELPITSSLNSSFRSNVYDDDDDGEEEDDDDADADADDDDDDDEAACLRMDSTS